MKKLEEDDCRKCYGEGRIANSDDGEPWSTWAALKPGEDLAVQLGIVRPIDCPVCKGTGSRKVAQEAINQPA